MTRLIVLTLLALWLVGCAFETGGLDDLAPVTWASWADCNSTIYSLPPNTAVQLLDGWGCIADEPESGRGEVACWNGEVIVTTIVICNTGHDHASSRLQTPGGSTCTIQVACD